MLLRQCRLAPASLLRHGQLPDLADRRATRSVGLESLVAWACAHGALPAELVSVDPPLDSVQVKEPATPSKTRSAS